MYCLTCSPGFRQATIPWKSASRFPCWSRNGRSTASVKFATGAPLGTYRSSGSRVSRPIRMRRLYMGRARRRGRWLPGDRRRAGHRRPARRGGRRRGGRRGRGGSGGGDRFGVMGPEREPEQVLIQPEQLPQGGRSAGIEREDEQDVIPVSGLLDGKGQLALAPALLALQDPAVFGDPLGDPFEGRAQHRFIEVGPENSNNFVSAHPARSLPLDCNRTPSLSAALPGRPCAGPPQPARGPAGQEGRGRVTATAPVFGSVSRSECTMGERGLTSQRCAS